mgnify:CR=1 FL=1
MIAGSPKPRRTTAVGGANVVQSSRDDMLKQILQMHPHSQALQIMSPDKRPAKEMMDSLFYEQQMLTADDRERYRFRYMNLPTRTVIKQSLLKLQKAVKYLASDDADKVPREDSVETVTSAKDTQQARNKEVENLASSAPNSEALDLSSDESVPTTMVTNRLPTSAGVSSKGNLMSSVETKRVKWERELEESKWLEGIEKLLAGTSKVVTLVQMGEPVVVQNPEGTQPSIYINAYVIAPV